MQSFQVDGDLLAGALEEDNAERLPLIGDSTPSRPRPRAFTLSHSAFGSSGTFPSTARSGPLAPPTLKSRSKLFFLQLFANSASAAFLIFIIVWALASRLFQAAYRHVRGLNADRHRRPWDTDAARDARRTERVTKDIRYYALRCGFDVVEQTVETKDGYLLKAFKVVCLKKEAKVHSDGRKGFPVLIQHGLFQSCGSLCVPFLSCACSRRRRLRLTTARPPCSITSEERSLAFWLAEHGCAFFLSRQCVLVLTQCSPQGLPGLPRQRARRLRHGPLVAQAQRPTPLGCASASLFPLGATSHHSRASIDYNIKELALYDLPALVDHVRRDTGYDKVRDSHSALVSYVKLTCCWSNSTAPPQIAFIGHSQGNATMFCSLAQGMVPELGDKLSVFIALAPAVYAGPLTTGFPFTALKNMRWKTWRRWFGASPRGLPIGERRSSRNASCSCFSPLPPAGLLDFIPLMRISYDWVPSRLFGLLGYQMFAFLFNWTDANWVRLAPLTSDGSYKC